MLLTTHMQLEQSFLQKYLVEVLSWKTVVFQVDICLRI